MRTVSPAWSSDALENCATYPVAACVLTSSKVEMTIEVRMMDKTTKMTTFTTVPESPGW